MTNLPKDSLDIDRLFVEAKAGDALALNEFCRISRQGLMQIASFRLRGWPQNLIADIVQDTLTTFIEKISLVDSTPTPFLRTILYNKIGNALRNHSNDHRFVRLNGTGQVTEFEEEFTAETDFRISIEQKDLLKHIAGAIDNLSEPYRTILTGIIEGNSIQEVWQKCSQIEPYLTRSGFDKRLSRGRRKLWKLLEGIHG